MFSRTRTGHTTSSSCRDGYRETIERGLVAIRSSHPGLTEGAGTDDERIRRLRDEIEGADAIVVGAGAGLSTAAGLTYAGERFERYFGDFAARFGIRDMYAGGFYPFPDAETRWAWWARHIYYNRYVDPAKDVYGRLLSLLEGRDHFVVTTNVDHQFQRAGIDRSRLFYTQGDYGLFQSVNPKIQKTYDNEEWVMWAMEAQGFVRDPEGVFAVPPQGVSLRIPTELVPKCPDDGSDMTMNLRSDDSFVEDAGWHRASAAYADYLDRHEGQRVLFLEIGVGANTPVIIKYPFWAMTAENPRATYACINYDGAFGPEDIEDRIICVTGDAAAIIDRLT